MQQLASMQLEQAGLSLLHTSAPQVPAPPAPPELVDCVPPEPSLQAAITSAARTERPGKIAARMRSISCHRADAASGQKTTGGP
ncbi:Hypothetical protein A7982_08304 [Minicystis rosea]|nr:Hypothetical protein A7982_08304 [Minicystis rosea]